MSTIGRIHSFESCGTVDGPGIRFIVFMQGCLMRCKYCHNRDTWDTHGGKEVTVDEIMKDVRAYRHFITASGGGVTASGGEAMLQPEFVRDFFQAANAEGIHTCLDTNGYIRKHTPVIDEVLDATDLVMLDLKQLNDEVHEDLVGVSNRRTLDFAKYLQKIGQKTWIRYVVVPGYTDDDDSAHRLGQFIQDMDNIEKVELLPYHQLGAHKWEALGHDYELQDVSPPSKEVMESVKAIIASYGHSVTY
ncbi:MULTISPECIES: pyruvate formate lyase 1-activating protein [unclassified Salinivibrio]|uniref:pyruvate formate lyase 1-activating protein n=1 Tax=unclassified Salinivibrio TaxID=2636825 RepID=UPI00128CA0CF|nr:MULTISPECIES: pyruvate formate lyase 1-activating protein [unclassified Salinivibrio]MPS31922.1 pyruvate formate lyase 1-activating protein [Salinivibrio sp. VYel7]MPX89729.1 pyruvate formate lyase 1-activating protein [Salinivibrio sp. VYel1]MPX93316.1 pyruvate formate lyase 1-activating protein [Salinivibrio sp. VYel9]MPX95857.1 pyruvate formate lyase 1-activating protein [Salinivibrio sp. VYel6]MPX99534.1 pyruvate formate lyase 1-activating protein [Salinivibrio sp. VYel4]